MNNTKQRRRSLWACVAAWLIFTLGAALLTAVIWELQELNVGIAEILFTLWDKLSMAVCLGLMALSFLLTFLNGGRFYNPFT